MPRGVRCRIVPRRRAAGDRGPGPRRARRPAVHRRVVGTSWRTAHLDGRGPPAAAGRVRPGPALPLPVRDRRRSQPAAVSAARCRAPTTAGPIAAGTVTGDQVDIWLIRSDVPAGVLGDLAAVLD